MTPDRVDRIQDEWRRERPDIDPSPQGVLGRLHRVAGELTHQITRVYALHDLSEGEFDVLCALRRAGAPYERQPADLARFTMITTGGLSKRLDRLEAAGLVERDRPDGGGDGRAKVARLTGRGLEAIDAAYTEHMANEARLAGMLPEADQRELVRILRAWSEALDLDADT